MFCCRNRQQSHHACVHASASPAANSTTYDQSIHGRGSAANSGTDFEEEDADEVQDLRIELGIHFAPAPESVSINMQENKDNVPD